MDKIIKYTKFVVSLLIILIGLYLLIFLAVDELDYLEDYPESIASLTALIFSGCYLLSKVDVK